MFLLRGLGGGHFSSGGEFESAKESGPTPLSVTSVFFKLASLSKTVIASSSLLSTTSITYAGLLSVCEST